MSVLNTLWWWQWVALGCIPLAIILLYFLKLKRQPWEVPSTFLWSRTIEDLHVNTIWQRLRRNLLLLLQLILVALIILALLRPGWRGQELADERFVLLIDNSASMSSRDEPPTRLERAKQQALEIVAQMKAGNSAMVISFSDSAQVVQTYTESRRALRRQIEAIAPTSRGTDLTDALRAAAGLANPGLTRLQDNQAVEEALPATMYIFSDGGFPSVSDFSLGNLEPVFVPCGQPDADNVGIVAFATDRNPENPQRMQAFSSVANFGSEPVTVLLELFIDDVSVDLVEQTIDAGQEKGWHFELPDLDEAMLKLVMQHDDCLPLDNVAYAAINRPRPAQVLLVTPGDETLRVALQTQQITDIAEVAFADPAVLADATHQSHVATGAYDLIIYDRCQPQSMPQANTLFLDALPPGDTWQRGPADGPPTIIDIDRVHPLTQLVDMNYVQIAEGHKLTPPLGSTVLFDSAIGPVFAIGPREGFEDAVVGFPLLTSDNGQTVPNTTWPLRPSFPVFIYNVVRYLGGSHGAAGVMNADPGTPLTFRSPSNADTLTVVLPNGEKRRLQPDGHRVFAFAESDAVGVYTVQHDGSNLVQRFVVNLFDSRESNIRPRPMLELGHATVTASSQMQPTRRELWKWIVLLGLLILALEWYIYNRRVYL